LFRHVTGDTVIRAGHSRPFEGALIDGAVATGPENTTAGQFDQIRQITADYRQGPAALLDTGRIAFQQLSRVWMSRMAKNIAR
jgi:hypothetical protein